MTEEQVDNGKRILERLIRARNIKYALENEQSYFVIALKNKGSYDTTVNFKDNTITQKIFPGIDSHLRSYILGLITCEIQHFEAELNAV